MPDMNNIDALRAELMAEVRAEADKIIEEAKAEAAAIVKGGKKKVKAETKAQKEAAEKLVPVKLFKDKGKYSGDVTVIHNGKTYVIQRGKEVMVPAKIAQIIKDSDIQRGYAADVIEGYQQEYEEVKDKL